MKRIFLIAVGIFLLAGSIYAEEIRASSRITSVTAYPDSAMITRTANVQVKEGEQAIVFTDIIPNIDENSLKVSGRGTAQVKIFGAQLKKEFLEKPKSEAIKKLEEQIQQVRDDLQNLNNEKAVLEQEKEFLSSIKLFSGDQLPKDLITKMPQAADLTNIADFLATRLSANLKKKISLEQEQRETNKKLNALQNELNELTSRNNPELMKRSIVVELEATKAGTLDIDLGYLARGVSWNMIYDARASLKAKEVELVSYGIAAQTTGEDWADVAMALSTAKPSVGGRMPYITPWFLRPYQPPVYDGRYRNELKKSKMMMQSAAMAPLKSDELGGVGGANEPNRPQEAEVAYVGSEQKGTALVYTLSRKASVKSDGSEHRLPICSQKLEAKYEYSACPKISPFAYFGCRVSNSKDLQLLAGRVNVFLDGDYVGASSVDNIGPGEKFDLYLGVDEGVKVERKLVEKKVDETLFGGIASSTKKTIFKYKVTVENYKNDKIKLNLFEPMPVSQDDRIVVKIGKVSIEPKQKDWQDRKGVWKWEFELAPQQKQELLIEYTVEHPRTMNVEGL